MIASLRGTLVTKTPTEIQVDVGGVCLAVSIALSAFGKLPEPGTQVTVLTHLIVREDLLQLYGFADSEERDLFRILISVNGIGPKMAIGILSGISVPDLRGAITQGNTGLLMAVPGVGRKLAERLILELRDKIGKLPSTVPGTASPGSPEFQIRSEALLALTSLGYSRQNAERAIQVVLHENPTVGTSLEGLVKAAIRKAHP